MSKILVTGSTGFVGRHLIPRLVAVGHQVRCAVLRTVDWLPAEQVLIDKIERQKDWTEALAGIDVVIHLAARVHEMNDSESLSVGSYYKINSLATKNLAEQAAVLKLKRFVYLSSIKVNGECTPKGSAFTEEIVGQPEDPYALSKLQAEQYLKKISEASDMEFVVLRPPLVYGPEVKANFLKMMQWVEKGWPLPFGRVLNRRHFIYIENLISALCAVLEDPRAANQVFLVSDEEAFSLTSLLRQVGKTMGKKTTLIPVPMGILSLVFKLMGLKGLNARLFSSLEVDTAKIRKQMGWVPPVSASEGLEKTAKWYRYEPSP